MTFQAWWLLMKLRKAQIYENLQFGIDEETMMAKTIPPEGIKPVSVKIRGYSASIDAVLEHLAECGYIEYDEYLVGKVRHKGWHLFQTAAWNTLEFLLRSIVVPVFVSFVTALITLWLAGDLKLP